MKSKSRTKLRDAMTTTNKLKPILIRELLFISRIGNPEPKKLITKLIIYTMKIPPVAAATPNLKFSVALINPDL